MEETVIAIGREIGLLAMVLVMLFLLGRYALTRLLDENKGIIPDRTRQQKIFEDGLVNELKEHNTAQLNKCDVHGQGIVRLEERGDIFQHAALKSITAALICVQKGPVLENGEKKMVERLLIEAKTKLES